MNEQAKDMPARRAVLGSISAAALAGVALGSAHAAAQDKSGGFTPWRHAQDAWMDTLQGEHRVFIDSDNIAGGTNALRYASNIINAHVNAYEGNEQDMAVIICYRHASTSLGFNDAMWEKYGKTFAAIARVTLPEGDATPRANPQMAAIQQQASKGVHFAICNSASTMMAGVIARETGEDAATVLAELTANIIVNAHMVPAGVLALTRAQEHGYSLLYSAA